MMEAYWFITAGILLVGIVCREPRRPDLSLRLLKPTLRF